MPIPEPLSGNALFSIRPQSGCPSSMPCPRRRHILCFQFWLSLSLLFLLAPSRVAGASNVSISNTSPQIVYTPFLCDATSLATDPNCSGAWNTTSIAGIPTVSTEGPSPAGADIVPQMFMAFRASALYMSTSAVSNASANFTISSPTQSASNIIDSAAGLVTIINLVESELTTLTITFIPGPNATLTHLDIGSILITVSDPDATSSFLPTMTLPPSMSLPTFLPTSSAASSTASASGTAAAASATDQRSLPHRAQIAEALSLVLGLGVGLSIIAGALFFWWRRRRRLREARQAWF